MESLGLPRRLREEFKDVNMSIWGKGYFKGQHEESDKSKKFYATKFVY